MGETLYSLGLDVGTTTTQLILSELTVENCAGSFSVPRMEITDRKIMYTGPVHMTPLLGEDRVDGAAIRDLVEADFRRAGIRREQIDTGAVIITGETSRKENAAAVLENLASFSGEFVVATAGPDLESRLAAQGSGAVGWSARRCEKVLHMDIGGGTTNLALICQGKIIKTGCLNVGGRLIRLDKAGTLTYVSPVLNGLTGLRVGQQPETAQLQQLAQLLTQALEMAAGLRPKTPLLDALQTKEASSPWMPEPAEKLSFSGGVAECIRNNREPLAFGDLGVLLGMCIARSDLCREPYLLEAHPIRATVIGAGCHSTQLSGSTVFLQNTQLPLKNMPTAVLSAREQALPADMLCSLITGRLEALEQWGVLVLPGWNGPEYTKVTELADVIARAVGNRPCYVALVEDMAKVLGHALSLRLPDGTPCLCIDRVHIPPDSYLDVGSPVGSAICVVVKTLIFEQ